MVQWTVVLNAPLSTEHTCGVAEKRGGMQEGNHSDTNNTLPLISLISSFLWLKVYYSGNQLLLCMQGLKHCQPGFLRSIGL